MIKSKTLQNVTRALPALLAVVALLFWPVLATGNCCCKRAEVEAKISGSPLSSCCQATVEGCCASESSCGSACSLPTDGERAVAKDCQCSFDCCQAFPVLLQVTQETNTHSPTAATATVAIDSPYRIASIDVTTVPRNSFQNAQDHCALVCRWLK